MWKARTKYIFFLSHFHIHMPSSELIIFVLNKNMFKRYFPNSVIFWTKADLLKQEHFCLLYKIFSPFLLPVICGGRHRRSPSVIIKVWSNIMEFIWLITSSAFSVYVLITALNFSTLQGVSNVDIDIMSFLQDKILARQWFFCRYHTIFSINEQWTMHYCVM